MYTDKLNNQTNSNSTNQPNRRKPSHQSKQITTSHTKLNLIKQKKKPDQSKPIIKRNNQPNQTRSNIEQRDAKTKQHQPTNQPTNQPINLTEQNLPNQCKSY
jgi:hypothetical protein